MTNALKHGFASLLSKSLKYKVLPQQATADARTIDAMKKSDTMREGSMKAN